MHFTRTVARNSAFGMLAQVAIKLLTFAFSVLILRHLGAESYGQYVGVLAFGAIFVFIADLGISQYIVRQMARVRDTADGLQQIQELFGNALYVRFLLSLFTAVLLIAAAWLTGRPLAMVGAIALGTIGLVLYSVQGTADGVLGAFERLDLSATSKVVSQFVFVVCGGAALYLGFGYYGLVIANLLAVAAMTWLCWRNVTRLGLRPGRIRLDTWLPLIRASVPFGIIGFTLGLSYNFNRVLLNVTRSDLETGYYNSAYNLIFSVAIISNIFNISLFPSLTRRAAASEHSLSHVYEVSLRYLMLASLPIAVGTCVLADRIVPFLYTAAYLPAVPALQIVIWTVPLLFASEFLGYVALIKSRERAVARAVLVSTSTNVVINLALVPTFGFLAAAVMTVVTEAVLTGQYVWMLRKTLRETNWRRSVLGPLAAALAMGGVVFVLRDLPLPPVIAVGAISYCGFVLGLRLLGAEELGMIRRMRHKSPDVAAAVLDDPAAPGVDDPAAETTLTLSARP